MPLRSAALRPLALCLLVATLFLVRATAQTFSFTTVPAPANTNGSSLAVDAAGNVFLADYDQHVIRQITSAGLVSIVAGRAATAGAADGSGDTARFRNPSGLALDSAGNLYVADSGNSAIRKITPAGAVTTLAGSVGQNVSNDGPVARATFRTPWALALDQAGTIYVVDRDDHVLRVITPAGVVSTLAGATGGSPAVDGVGPAARFANPNGVAVGRDGNIFIADLPYAVRKVTPAGVVTTLAGDSHAGGSVDGTGSAARFLEVAGIVVTPAGDCIVTDSANTTVRLISPAGVVRTLAGQVLAVGSDDGVGGLARFTTPRHIAVDPSGGLWISEAGQSRLRHGLPYNGPLPPIMDSPPHGVPYYKNQFAGANTPISFSVIASGAPPLSIQWTKNGSPIAGATDTSFVIASANVTDQGQYSVTATNPAGAYSSLPIAVSVYTPKLTSFASRHSVSGGSFLWSIAASENLLVTVGTGGTILTSPDGRAWTARNSGTSDWLVGVTYAAGKFVAVGDRGTILLSPDGLTWTRALVSGTTQRLNNIAYNVGTFVAVGEGGAIVTSPDAQTWTARVSGVKGWLRGLVYEPYRPLAPYYSSPAVNVINATSGDNGSARFYASGENGVLLSSASGISWSALSVYRDSTATNAPSPATIALNSADLEALTTGPVGIGQDGTISISSSGAFTFTDVSKTPSFPGGLTLVTNFAIYSTYLSKQSIGLAGRFRSIARGAGAIFTMGENGVIAASSDAYGPWALIPSGTSANLVGAVFRGDTLFIVGENETILESAPIFPSRLANISTRGRIVGESQDMTTGFVVSGGTPKQILLRAAGPALGAFGISDPLAAPTITLYDGTGRSLATNTGWSDAALLSDAAARLGAFPLVAHGADSALLQTLPPGNYTARVTGSRGTSGLAIVEAYDADAPTSDGPRTINISTRGFVGTGNDVLIAGFVISGADTRRLLIRAVGPSLSAFGLTGTLANPRIELVNASGFVLSATSDGWSKFSGDINRTAAAQAGAFALQEGSNDVALVSTLVPGSYTVRVSGVNNSTGLALVEVYELP